AGSVSNEVGHVIDLVPTFMEVAGAKYPREYRKKRLLTIEEKSLIPIIHGEKFKKDRELGWVLCGSRAYRIGKWKLVWGVTAQKWELYDMEADRTETHDLSSKHPDIVKRLSNSWLKWAKRSEVPRSQIS